MTMDSKKVSSVMDGIPWKIGGDIGNEAVRGYIASNNENGEEIIATLLGIGEKTGVGALFGKKAGSALGGDYLLLTNKKVIVIKAGVGTWSTGAVGVKAKTYIFEHISSVDVSKGLMFGDLEIVSSGMVEKGSGGFFSAAEKDSVVQFEKEFFDEVQKLANKIMSLAQEARHPKVVLTQSSPDIPEQIKKFAKLRDEGILTNEEFIQKKKQLLEKM